MSFESELNSLFEEVKSILATQPEPSIVQKILDDNSEIYNWTKEGHDLHKELELEKCAYCDNKISNERIKELNQYFSDSSSILRDRINKSKDDIDLEIDNLNNSGEPNSKNDFVDAYQEDFQRLQTKLEVTKRKYINLLTNLQNELERKVNGNIFNSLTTTMSIGTVVSEIEEIFESINGLINDNNLFIDNFNENQKEARRKLIYHNVSTFISDHDYSQKKSDFNHSIRRRDKYEWLIEKIKSKNISYEEQLKSVTAGKDELNKYIKLFLNNEYISISVTNEDKFVLYRNDTIANNLSEGEKTAISFSYFLVVLESLFNQEKLINTIVFIDDPISSLDANNLSNVYNLLEGFFFRQNKNNKDPNEYTICCKQLFISTHNFEFFTFLKGSKKLNKPNKSELYYIKNIDKKVSIIQNMPKALSQYKSEYVYLFSIIYRYYTSGYQEYDNNIILLPNAFRRFLEIYTLLKLPGSSYELDGRLKELTSDSHQLKMLHYFSHFTSIEKIIKHDELLTALPRAAEELIELVKKDKQHFESLVNSI